MTIKIVRLGTDDWPTWRSVRLAALADAPSAFCSTLADWVDAPDERWRARLRDVPLNLIAKRDGQPVGQVSGTKTPRPDVAELISMWVAPSARGAGVGDALVESVIAWALSEGHRRLELSVKKSNAPARRLYGRHEFTTAGVGDAADEVRMSRATRLGTPARVPNGDLTH